MVEEKEEEEEDGEENREKERRTGKTGSRAKADANEDRRNGGGLGWMVEGWWGSREGWRFMILLQSWPYRSPNKAAAHRQTYFHWRACLLAAYTVFCDEDFGRWPSSFQMDVLHHEFSESMFCWYITSLLRWCARQDCTPVCSSLTYLHPSPAPLVYTHLVGGSQDASVGLFARDTVLEDARPVRLLLRRYSAVDVPANRFPFSFYFIEAIGVKRGSYVEREIDELAKLSSVTSIFTHRW